MPVSARGHVVRPMAVVATAAAVLALPAPQGHAGARAAGAALSVQQSITPSPLYSGAAGTYTLTVGNTGTATAEGVTATATIDPGLTVSDLPAQCTASGTTTVTCTADNVAAGADVEFPFTVTAPADTADGTNVATSATATADNPAQSVSADRLITVVKRLSHIDFNKTASPSHAAPGDLISYTLTFTNLGSSDVDNVYWHDALDGNLVTPLDTSQCGSPGGLTISCNLGTVLNGQTVTRTFTVKVRDDVADGTVIENCADVFEGTPATGPARSCASTEINVPNPTPTPTPTPTSTPTITTTSTPTTAPGGSETPTPAPTHTGEPSASASATTDPSPSPAPDSSATPTPHPIAPHPTATTPTGGLAATGTNPLPLLGSALAALLLGGLLTVPGRKRNRTHPGPGPRRR